MSQLTKHAIMNTFMQLLTKKPFDKITIADIVDGCGISRRTFYYHFRDIYDLTEKLFIAETQKVIDEYTDSENWEDSFIDAARFITDNREAVYHIYKSSHREELEKYIDKISFEVMSRFIENISKDIDAGEQDKLLIIDFYRFALVGMVKEWLDHGLSDKPDEMIRRIGTLFYGNIRNSLIRSTKD